MTVEQNGTNNNAGFPVHIANRTDKTTPAHHDKQKPQCFNSTLVQLKGLCWGLLTGC